MKLKSIFSKRDIAQECGMHEIYLRKMYNFYFLM
jgi:hypothetical protein